MPIWILAIQWLSRSILGFLILLSVWSVATMIRCARMIKEANGSDSQSEFSQITKWIEKQEWDRFRSWAENGKTLRAGTARAILQASVIGSPQVDRAVRSFLSLEKTRLEEGLTVLATLGSNAPFIGLFGTVLGIIQSFGALGAHQNSTSEIMIGISEALVATAVGLFVAIPAVVAFNALSRKLRVILINSEALKDFYLSRVRGNENGS